MPDRFRLGSVPPVLESTGFDVVLLTHRFRSEEDCKNPSHPLAARLLHHFFAISGIFRQSLVSYQKITLEKWLLILNSI